MWFNIGKEGSDKAGTYSSWEQVKSEVESCCNTNIMGKENEAMSTCCKPLLLLGSHQLSWLPLSFFIYLSSASRAWFCLHLRFNFIFHLLNRSFYLDILPSTHSQNMKQKIIFSQTFYHFRLKNNFYQ